jgi:hypothetical protein
MRICLPGLSNVDNIDSVRASLPEVRVHVNLQVLGSEMALSAQEHLNILRSSIEDWWEVGRSHLCGLTVVVVVKSWDAFVVDVEKSSGRNWRVRKISSR